MKRAQEAKAEAAKLAVALDREPNAIEATLIEQAAFLIVRSRYLRAKGKDAEADDAARLLHRLMRALADLAHNGRKPQTFLERLKAAAR